MKLINELLTTPEDEYHDFKAQWYEQYTKSELIKDIFSFVNTSHHKDCYLIIGVNDKHEVIGVENDPNRLNTEKLTTYLHSLPIANSHTPKVIVQSIEISDHTIDVIVIKDTNDVPVYLDENKQPKQSKCIHAGQIFARENDTNTAINSSASDYLVERLWKKRFGLDLPIKDQYKVKLSDYSHWKYFELDKIGFQYTLDPDFCMYLEEDDETRYRAESYNLGQFRLSMSWNKLILKYRNRTIDELLVVFMDSATFMTVTPSLGSISPMSNSDMLTFQYYLADSLDFAVEKLILNMKRSSITPNYNQQSKLLKRIVIFKNYNQLKQIKSVLQKQDEYIKGKCAPTKEQLELCRGALSMDFGKDTPEMNQGHIEVMCEEANVSQFINNYLQSEIINNKRSR